MRRSNQVLKTSSKWSVVTNSKEQSPFAEVAIHYLPPTWPSLATLVGGSCTKNMTSTGGCSYGFMYSWWWVWLTPETCRIINRLLCVASGWTIFNILLGLFDPWRMSRYVVPKRRYGITILRCAKSQKSSDLISIAAEAWSDAFLYDTNQIPHERVQYTRLCLTSIISLELIISPTGQQ